MAALNADLKMIRIIMEKKMAYTIKNTYFVH